MGWRTGNRCRTCGGLMTEIQFILFIQIHLGNNKCSWIIKRTLSGTWRTAVMENKLKCPQDVVTFQTAAHCFVVISEVCFRRVRTTPSLSLSALHTQTLLLKTGSTGRKHTAALLSIQIWNHHLCWSVFPDAPSNFDLVLYGSNRSIKGQKPKYFC